MSSGGGGGSSNTQTVQTVKIPPFLEDATLNAINRAQAIADQPYQPYGGQTIADLTSQQQQGIARGTASATDPRYASMYGTAENLAAGSAANPGDIAPWMSPYVMQALQPQITAIQRQGQVTANNINATATGAGAFGDARTGVQQGINDRNTMEAISNAVGTGYQSAYDRAVAAAQAAGQQRLQAGAGLAQIAGQQYGQAAQSATDLTNYGKIVQDENQARLAQAYQDFVNQREYPKEGLNTILAAIQGVPYSTTRLTTTPYNATAANLGALTSVLGLTGKLTTTGG